jgi:hypothetical protein
LDRLGVFTLVGVLLLGATMKGQNSGVAKTLDITVKVLDGRNGKPLANQHLLVFTGLSNDSVETHAQHTSVTTDKDGTGTLTIYPDETQWLQVFADGRIPCFLNPNQTSFRVNDIVSRGLVTPNTCSALSHDPSPGHFIIFVRPAAFMEKMKQ